MTTQSDATEELRRAGEAVATQKQRYAELFDLAPDAYAVTDADCVIVEVNQAAIRLLGRGSGTLVGTPLPAYIDEDVSVVDRIAALRAGQGEQVAWETRVRSRGDRLVPVAVRVAPARDAWGQVAGFRWILHDLQDRRAAEGRERASTAVLTARLREHSRRVAELEHAKSEFLRLGSHELRSPLSIIQGYVSMALAGDFGTINDELARSMTIVYEQCRVMSSLIDRMLDASLVGEGSVQLQRGVADLRDIVQRAAELVPPRGGTARSSLRLSLGNEPVPVNVDPEQLTKAITALLDNALKYSPADAAVLCEVGMDNKHARAFAAVNDLGRGIADEERSHLFERFGRVVTPENSNIRGGGLGLFLAREIARLHGGDVLLAGSAPGSGSTFVLDLPLADTSS
ncbi:MAG: PAS domain-containing protein [Candidatus Dormibacteraeota bacterium]|nr:PAS domain-containing protein [Candidatus Dormibacteraeota bacterium]MBV9525801.1 PAS domain-containing protein [Candidatus Dormibacteraeota bacterium]